MPADIIIKNANIRTMDRDIATASAIAVTANLITRVGDYEDMRELASEDTLVVDAEGAAVLPGFVEAHAHIFPGAKSLHELDLQWTQGPEALEKAVREHAAKNPDLNVVIGRSTNYGVLGEGTRPTRHDLDRILPDSPLFLRSGDYHNAWVNTIALEKAGALHGAETGPGSEIVVGDDGLATGELQEFAAMDHVLSRLAPPGRESLGLSGREPENLSAQERRADKQLLTEGLRYCASLGITTIHNMDGNFYQCGLLREIETDGELCCRIEMPYHFLPGEPVENLEKAHRMAKEFDGEMLWSGRVKMFMDGVLDAWTAYMVDEYADKPGTRGNPLFTAEHFNSACIAADRLGLQISVHAIGDGAVRMTLDGFEAAASTNGARDSRHRIEHIEVVHPQDIDRFSKLGVVASVQPIHAPGNGCFPKEPTIHTIGEARWPFSFAWKTLKDAGAQVVYGTDWPVSPADPVLSIRHAVTRKRWSEGDPDQRLSLHETLEAYTHKGAYTCFRENKLGSLSEGMLADIVVLDGDFPEDTVEDSSWPKVRMTICDGRITYAGT